MHGMAAWRLNKPPYGPHCCSITVTYVDKDGKDHTVLAPIGKNLLELAHENEIDLEGEWGWGVMGCLV